MYLKQEEGPRLIAPLISHSPSLLLLSSLVDLLAANWISQRLLDTGIGVPTNF